MGCAASSAVSSIPAPPPPKSRPQSTPSDRPNSPGEASPLVCKPTWSHSSAGADLGGDLGGELEDLEADICTDNEVLFDPELQGERALELLAAQQQLLDLQKQAYEGLASLRALKALDPPPPVQEAHPKTNKNGFRMRTADAENEPPVQSMPPAEAPVSDLDALKARAQEALAALANISANVNLPVPQAEASVDEAVQAVQSPSRARASAQLIEQVVLSDAFLVRLEWRTIGTIGMVSAGWNKTLFGDDEQAERTWQCVCLSIGASESLYVPPAYCRSWKRLFFDMLYPARTMWTSAAGEADADAVIPTAAERSYQIQVFARFRPGDPGSNDDQLFLPLRQRLKLRRKGDKVASEHFGLPVKAVRELLEAGVLEAGADLPPEIVRALAEAASLDQAAEASIRAAMRDPHDSQHGTQDDGFGGGGAGLEAAANLAAAVGEFAATHHQAGAYSTEGGGDEGEEEGEQSGSGAVAPHKRRHGSARLLTVQPAKAVMFIPGQGFRPFIFAQCFDHNCTQRAVYDESARDAVCSVLNGFNACLFVYGQTGSGKTHTIFGPDSVLADPATAAKASAGETPQSAGMVLRAVSELIARSGATGADCGTHAAITRLPQHRAPSTVSLSASYVEIYNEQVTDLLRPDAMADSGDGGTPTTSSSGGTVQVRDGALVGTVSRKLESLSDGLEMLREGEVRKTRAATAMNERSSRAHTMVIIKVTQARQNRTGNGVVSVTSELALVDLAGCEQLKQSRAEGKQKKEATAINSSLMVLRKCISALVEGKPHVPFYESKLTMLLRPAFSGNSRTTAVVCAAPEPSNAEQTLSALRFGEDCGTIATKASLQGVSSVKQALETIVLALERCEADLEALTARGQRFTQLPAYRKLQEKFKQLSAKRAELEAVEQQATSARGSAEARRRRKEALKGVQHKTDMSNALAEAEQRQQQQGGGGFFIPFN